MKTALLLVVAALALASVAARCPNGCSGHGNCGRNDKCTCWANWQGNDCALRTCGYDFAWGLNKYDPHFYAECSNKGICDRATGLCDCFDEYEGRACTRSSCPNGCSGHGKCRYISDQSNSATYGGWDAEKIQVCVCDGGFYGPDCSQRYCPMGDDPMTVCDDAASATRNDYDIQRVTITFQTNPVLGGGSSVSGSTIDDDTDEFVLKFTDPHGEVWTTQRIEDAFAIERRDNTTANELTDNPSTLFVDAADRVRDALKALPNQVIPDVVVTPSTNGTSGATTDEHLYQRSWDISFTSPRNSGDQNDLQCFVRGCQTAGCQPMYKQMRHISSGVFANDFSSEITSTTTTTGVTLTADSVFDAIDTDDYNSTNRFNFDYKVVVIVYDNNTFSEDDGRSADEQGDQGFNYKIAVSKYGDSSQDWNQDTLLAGREEAATSTKTTYFHAHYELNFAGLTSLKDTYKRIPVEYSKVSAGHGAFVRFGSREPTPGTYMWLVSLASCSVDGAPSDLMSLHPNRENVECSNRGECDASSGMCACHEGYYGDNCQSQTILV